MMKPRMAAAAVLTLVTIPLGFAALFSEGHVRSGVKEDWPNRRLIAALGV